MRFFIFLVFTYNIKECQNPISEARNIARGVFWKIIGVFLVNIIVISLFRFVFTLIVDTLLNANSPNFIALVNSWYAPATRNFGMIILYQIIYSLIDIIFAPLFICLLTTLFTASKAKKELRTKYQVSYSPVRKDFEESFQYPSQKFQDTKMQEKSAATQDIQIQGRFYCPFCGNLIQSPKKFCPKCGEALEFINE